VILNLRLIVAGATVAGAVSLSALLFGSGGAAAEPGAPPVPAEQAAGSDPATVNADGQKDAQKEEAQPKAAPGNGLPCPLCSLNLPPAPIDIPPPDIPPPIQVTVPVGVSLGLPSLPLFLPPPQLPPPPQVPLPPPPSIPLPPPPSIPLPPPPF
jgi:hypothetical protein